MRGNETRRRRGETRDNVRVLGIDCGTTRTGYGVVESRGPACRALSFGVIRASARQTLAQRLKHIHRELEKLIRRFDPDAVAVEEVFQAFNVKSAMQLNQVRGVVLLAAARAQRPVREYSALVVKKSVVGYGRAEKHQVQHMVQRLLALPEPPEPADASDALAVALCHLHHERALRPPTPTSF
ncbi:MAG: crossover junction endodeoxyribonuclease RuvC [Acidobacteria bacterium]|nr:crossover junction endodeoxyribonuclease RuvC [Acidobacteriota bacterium]